MAKRKDSVALFEVITATKRRQEAAAAARGSAPSPSVLRTPKWWFKSKGKADADAAGASDANDPTYRNDPTYGAPALPAPKQTVIESQQPPVASANPAVAVVQRVAPAPERLTIPAERNESANGGGPFGLDFPADQPPAATGPKRSWLARLGGAKKVGVDPDRREVTVRFRYTTAIIVGFAICVALGLAYVSGRQSSKAVAGPNAVSSEDVRRGPVLPGVTDVRAGNLFNDSTPEIDTTSAPLMPDGGRQSRGSGAIPPVQPPPVPPVANKPKSPATAGGVEESAKRVIGLNYVIIQSYPNEKDALAAQEALASAGVPTTIENPPPKGLGADPSWHAVVGIHGFPRTSSSPEYRAYRDKIDAVGKKFAANSKFRRFEPLGYKWR